MADFSKDSLKQRARSPTAYIVQYVKNRRFFFLFYFMSLHLVLEIEEIEEEDEGKGTVKMIQFIQRAPRSQVVQR